MFKSLRSWLVIQEAPTSQEIEESLGKISSLISDLKQQAEQGRKDVAGSLKQIEDKFTSLKQKIPTKDGLVIPDAWQAKDEGERREVWIQLGNIQRELLCLNQDDLRVGRFYFSFFLILFLLVVVAYLASHKSPRPATVDPAVVIESASSLRNIELLISELTKAEARGEEKEKDREQLASEITKQIMVLRDRLKGVELGFPALRLLGVIEAEAERKEITKTESFGSFSKALLPDLESLRTAFLWNDRRGRWFEIIWWAEFGVLVGILFYIAGCIGRGRFVRQEIVMFWTEAIISPVVVLVIFFLFTLTGITGISTTETSITGNAGFAFIFGFAIRRTLGLLDIIKKRIFPEPSPASGAGS